MGGWVYFLTNRPFGSLYTAVTADLARRLLAHREERGAKHAKAYNLDKLVLVEPYPIKEAIAREKQLKAWKRLWKRRLISEANPDWEDLASRFNR